MLAEQIVTTNTPVASILNTVGRYSSHKYVIYSYPEGNDGV